MPRFRWILLPALLTALLALAARPSLAASPLQEPPLDPDTLANLTYPTDYTASGTVTLADGRYEDPAARTLIVLPPEYTAWGDVDGDGDTDAVVLLGANTGGSGVFSDLVVVLDEDDTATPAATTFLGDRIQINSTTIADDGVITVDMVTQGPDEPMCCGTLNVVRTYTYADGALTLASETEVPPSALPADWLDNATLEIPYISPDWAGSDPITLSDGRYESSDPTNPLIVVLTPYTAQGDLDADGDPDMAALVAVNTGGSGVFVDLHAFLNEGGEPVWTALAPLGDRPKINSLEIVDGQIVVDFVTQGPEDPMCCPTLRVVQTYALEDGDLVLVDERQPAAESSGLTAEALPNATVVVDTPQGPQEITFVDGVYTSDDPGNPVTITLLPDMTAIGDMNGDGADDAAVVAATSYGGSGTFVSVHVLIDSGGAAQWAGSAALGDRPQVNTVAIEDGVLTVDYVTQGPEDPMCCPTQQVTRSYVLTDNGLEVVAESSSGSAAPADATADPAAEPATATLNAGGGAGMWLDPAVIGVLSGLATDPARVEGASLAEGCSGLFPARPDVVLQWADDPDADALRLFLLNRADPALAVVAPDGSVICNDDAGPLTLNPLVQIDQPQPGRYAIFVGSANNRPARPGLLIATTTDLDPTTFNLNALVPNQAATGNAPRLPAASLLHLAGTVTATVDGEPVEFEAGGAVPVSNLDLGGAVCSGFASVIPTARFAWEGGDAETITVYAEAAEDTTLIVRDPSGAFTCGDNADGAANLNPVVSVAALAGDYAVWVGVRQPQTMVLGALLISTDPAAAPQPLVAE